MKRVGFEPLLAELDLPNLLPGLGRNTVGREKALALQAREAAEDSAESVVGPVRWIVPIIVGADRSWLRRLECALRISSDSNFEVILWGVSGIEFSVGEGRVRCSAVERLAEINPGDGGGWIGILPSGVLPQPETVAVVRRSVAEGVSIHADYATGEFFGGISGDPDLYSFYGYNSYGAAYLTAFGAWEGVLDILGGMTVAEASLRDVARWQGAATCGAKVRVPLRLFVADHGGPEDAVHPHGKAILDRIARRDLGGRFLEERPRSEFGAGTAPTVGLVIPFRDQSDLTSGTLRSLGRQSGEWIEKVVLVDNGSGPEEAARVRGVANAVFGGERVVWIRDEGPFNFARLNNRGADAAGDCDLYWFCNNDIEIDDCGFLGELCGYLQLPEVGMVGGGLYYPDGSLQSAGIFNGPMGPQVAKDPETERATCFREVAALTFACVLIRREAWSRVGGLDEVVCPNGFGDAVFGHRLRECGWRILVDPALRVRHLESPSRGIRPEAIERWQLHCSGIPMGGYQDCFSNGPQPFVRMGPATSPTLWKRIYRTFRAARQAWTENRNRGIRVGVSD